MAKNDAPVIRRIKKVQGGGHHGGSWKVAFADFATAMMAFFLLMWLLAAATKEQRGAISEYFNNPHPSLAPGRSSTPARGQNGPGGASTSLIKLGGNLNVPRENSGAEQGQALSAKPTAEEIKKLAKKQERRRLESLMQELNAAIEASQSLAPFKDQLLLEIVPTGLRIQIIDKQNRSMFDLGSSTLKPYTVEILRQLSKFIQEVPNRISISGHTDVTPYGNQAGYTNWELSADRANAARRALVSGGLSDDKVAIVVGLSSSVLFDKAEPSAATNRRISIVVMNKDAEEEITDQQSKDFGSEGFKEDDTGADAEATPAEQPAEAQAPAHSAPGPAPQPTTPAAAAPAPQPPAAARPAAAPH